MSVEVAAAELDRRADRFLEKRRWMLDQAASETTEKAVGP
jgi:multiple sugar transport system substrate-binding protein